ncbi:hypothetical protein EJ03DRAFT_299853 [Teratosphaeria nubilosa]|uniref:Pericentrin/AKAP-450 centrosomal targeting domain-containing protein n=1 Tax=Teratosphaeria nubilosa TaxID=161662 RepID=A0A6G1KZG3_9PEZI|nr:hypothetical protein EJ03DRAFT_299853 [Teratosphaeria nubilosa]
MLESDLQFAQQEKTIAEERMDLHDMVKRAKIEAEDLQIKLTERDRNLAAAAKRENELSNQLANAQQDIEDLNAHISDLESRMQTSSGKERELRSQLHALKDAKIRIEELEMQLGDRKGSSSGHARREAELRSQLRDAKLELESLQFEVQEKDDRLHNLTRKEQELRDRLKKARSDDTVNQAVESKLESADLELEDLSAQVAQLDAKLKAAAKREGELKMKLQSLQNALEADRSLDGKQWSQQLATTEKRHEAELKGLAKQIQFLRAKCYREGAFRADLTYTKKFFLMQVDVYNKCNQADLRLLEEMGITPDVSFRERRHSLKTVGLMVMGVVRMRRLMESWAGSRRLQESLLRKLEGMRRGQGRSERVR